MNPIDLVTLGKGMKDLLDWAATITDAAKRLEAVNTITNLQQALLSAKADNDQLRTQQFDLQKEIFELKNQIRDYQDWNKTKEQYELAQQPNGAVLFIHKVSKVKACPICMGNQREMFLQPGSPGWWFCNNCNKGVQWELHHPDAPIPVVGRRPSGRHY